MNPIKTFSQSLKERLFNAVVSNRLVYNTSWEDPRVDRKLLRLDTGSRVAMITGAGCNALDYLLDRPARIDTVDVNPAQNALLELKKALFDYGDPELLFRFFGRGACAGAPVIYRKHLRSRLPGPACRFWDTRINYFSSTSAEPSFYYRGTAGKVALALHRRIRRKGLYRDILHLLESRSIEEQRYYFDRAEPELWNGFTRWLLSRDATLSLLGVPGNQRELIEEDGTDMLTFIRRSLREVFTRRPLRDNYFWRVYLTGRYTRDCCPNYLKQQYFHLIREQMDTIDLHTSTLSDFLAGNPCSYTHFVLLDHQDWLVNANRNELEREWKLILRHSRPGTRILFRSAGAGRSFIPGFARERLRFHEMAARRQHGNDRVGTYRSTHLAEVDP